MDSQVKRFVDEIDAAVFSSDVFLSREGVKYLREYLERWERGLKGHELVLDDLEKNPE